MTVMMHVEGVHKTFTLHNQDSARLPVLGNANLSVAASEAVVLSGASGSGKSTLLRILFGNYKPTAGRVAVRHRGRMIDLATAQPRVVLDIRRWTISWVSQFLRVIPRVTTLDLVREPMLLRGVEAMEATRRTEAMLARVNLPENLWRLAPQTFSGGEQQRVNIARSFVDPSPIMLLDEPTASLDAANRDVAVALIADARAAGSAIVGIFHDETTRARVATRIVDVGQFKSAGLSS